MLDGTGDEGGRDGLRCDHDHRTILPGKAPAHASDCLDQLAQAHRCDRIIRRHRDVLHLDHAAAREARHGLGPAPLLCVDVDESGTGAASSVSSLRAIEQRSGSGSAGALLVCSFARPGNQHSPGLPPVLVVCGWARPAPSREASALSISSFFARPPTLSYNRLRLMPGCVVMALSSRTASGSSASWVCVPGLLHPLPKRCSPMPRSSPRPPGPLGDAPPQRLPTRPAGQRASTGRNTCGLALSVATSSASASRP